jgi:hypothetical protein
MALPPVEFFSEALQQVKSVFAKAPPMGVFRGYETGKLATVIRRRLTCPLIQLRLAFSAPCTYCP